MDRDTVRRQLLDVLEAKAAEPGVDVVDVEVEGATQRPVVCVRIDHADESMPTITLDEVSAQTDWVSEAVEDADPFAGAYVLEVSSPGMDRPLRRRRDFERFAGEEVSLATTATEGRRRYTGTLEGLDGDDVVLTCDGREERIPFDEVRTCKIRPAYDFSTPKPAKRGKKGKAEGPSASKQH